MRFDGAVIKEQGVTFAVVVVKRYILDNQAEAARTQMTFRRHFAGLPIVLMGQDRFGRATYWGRPDLSRFLANTPIAAIPWREYTLA